MAILCNIDPCVNIGHHHELFCWLGLLIFCFYFFAYLEPKRLYFFLDGKSPVQPLSSTSSIPNSTIHGWRNLVWFLQPTLCGMLCGCYLYSFSFSPLGYSIALFMNGLHQASEVQSPWLAASFPLPLFGVWASRQQAHARACDRRTVYLL